MHLAEVVALLQIQDISDLNIMDWNLLETETHLNALIALSYKKPQAIFKHSTRCSISTMAKGRMDRSNVDAIFDCYYLDLIAYRSLSNLVAETFNVQHESPQILLIKNGECIFDESHSGIDADELQEIAFK